MLAHELRNPLAAIGNAVNVSTRSGLQEHIDWSMEVITRQMKHLTRLIDDLMDVSRISRGKIELRKAILDATPILESAMATVKTLVEERKHTLEVSIDRGNLWVNADPTRLEQVVVNLLNNAAKYSENAGHIRLSARIAKGTRSSSPSVTGASASRRRSCRRCSSCSPRETARSPGAKGGSASGSPSSRSSSSCTAGRHGRERGAGQGEHVHDPTPRGAAGRPRRGTTRQARRRPRGKKSRILVVDDNVDTARGMERLLKLLGHEVATAHTGPEALKAARGHCPEFILLDIGLPGMDGYEVAARLRLEEHCKHSVIVAVSGYGQEEDRRRSREAGFDHHLIKPLDHDALLSLLSTGGRG